MLKYDAISDEDVHDADKNDKDVTKDNGAVGGNREFVVMDKRAVEDREVSIDVPVEQFFDRAVSGETPLVAGMAQARFAIQAVANRMVYVGDGYSRDNELLPLMRQEGDVEKNFLAMFRIVDRHE